MTYWTFIRKNALRNKRRTALTVLSVAFSLFLLITLQTVLDSLMSPPETKESALRLAVRHAVSLGQPMPEAYGRQLAKVPHVKHVMAQQWFGGQYKDPKNSFPNFAVGHESFFSMYPDFEFTPGAEEAFMKDRMAALSGTQLMEQFGWSVGDTVTLTGTVYPVDLEFHIVGTYEGETDSGGTFFFRHDYLQESGVDYGMVGSFWLMADSAEAVPGIIEHVDTMFRNTPAETKTESEKAFQLGFISMLGNIQLLIGSISMVVAFTMLLVAGSTMAMTIRERLREVAILKAIGYPQKVILVLVLGEASAISLMGALVGIGMSKSLAFADMGQLTGGFVSTVNPGPVMLVVALGVGLLMGVIAGLFPAIQASRMTINEAMHRLG
jgi:putative ABC transport system permease protein